MVVLIEMELKVSFPITTFLTRDWGSWASMPFGYFLYFIENELVFDFFCVSFYTWSVQGKLKINENWKLKPLSAKITNHWIIATSSLKKSKEFYWIHFQWSSKKFERRWINNYNLCSQTSREVKSDLYYFCFYFLLL